MLIVFVLDTTPSMNQKASGFSLLDIAKCTAENVIKARQKERRSERDTRDRFALVTCADGVGSVRVSPTDNPQRVLAELKCATATDLGPVNTALARGLEMLNLRRVANNGDTYGAGRCAWAGEQAMILVLTDGGVATGMDSVVEKFEIPRFTFATMELTMEPFRWDQRIWCIVLRVPAVGLPVSAAPPPISAMCGVTGGKSHIVSNMRTALMAGEAVAKEASIAMVLATFDVYPKDPSIPPLLHVKLRFQPHTLQGQWPIPEAFPTDMNMPSLPPRSAEPVLVYTRNAPPNPIPDGFPVDTYEIEPCALLDFVRSGPKLVFVLNSAGQTPSPLGSPCGLLRTSPMGGVQLIILPYNFPKLFVLLADAPPVGTPPAAAWRASFERYLIGIPACHLQPLKNALRKWGLDRMLGENLAPVTSQAVLRYLKNTRVQARTEIERRLAATESGATHQYGAVPATMSAASIETNAATNSMRDIFTVSRTELFDFATAAACRLQQDDSYAKHTVPIAAMGDYQAAVRNELRDPLADTRPVFVPFGNPFKAQKITVEEEADVGPDTDTFAPASPRRNKRRSSLLAHSNKAARSAGSLTPPRTPDSQLSDDSSAPSSPDVARPPSPSMDMMSGDSSVPTAAAAASALSISPPPRSASPPVVADAMEVEVTSGVVPGFTNVPAALATLPSTTMAMPSASQPIVSTAPAAALMPSAAPLRPISPTLPRTPPRPVVGAGVGATFKELIARELRKPGKNYEPVLALLRGMSQDKRGPAIDFTMEQANLLKKSSLVDALKAFKTAE